MLGFNCFYDYYFGFSGDLIVVWGYVCYCVYCCDLVYLVCVVK